MRAPCHFGFSRKYLICCDYSEARSRLRGRCDGELAGRRQILPGRLHSINHKRPSSTPKVRRGAQSGSYAWFPSDAAGHAMRIYGPNGTTLNAPAAGPRRVSSTGFSLPDAPSTSESRPAIAPKPAANLDALLAMQGIEEDPAERRKRSVRRGKGALDVLDELKIALLSGSFDSSTVGRLRAAAADLKSSSGDPGLDAVLSEIELRVEVELAKAGQA
jgi:hypothetical protein